VNLDTATRGENRDDARLVGARIKRPEIAPTVAAQPRGSSASSTLQTQWRDIAKDLPLLVPQAPVDDAEPNDGFVREGLSKERRRSKAIKPQRSRTGIRFWLLNKWQGQVLSVGQDTFKVQLHDAAHPGTVEHAELFISDLPEDGRALLRPGALFYWMIGYRDEGSRQRTRASVVWMRRSGIMGPEKFKAALDSVQRTWDAVFDGPQHASHR
jgi:hypothetical protein